MELAISSPSAGIDEHVYLKYVLDGLRRSGHVSDLPVTLINDIASPASLAKVKNGLRDLCALTLAYLGDALRGDSSSYPEAKADD